MTDSQPRGFNRPALGDERAIHDIADLRPLHALAELIEALGAQNLPPQLGQAIFSVTFTAADQLVLGTVPKLLIPRNPRRMSFLVASTSSNGVVDQFSVGYGAPTRIKVGAANPIFVGATRPGGSFFQESNATVSQSDIWVWLLQAAPTLPQTIIGFEGSLTPDGNRYVGPWGRASHHVSR